MVQCYVCGKQTRDNGRTYHVFPLKDPILLDKWLKSINCDGKIKITPYTRICSDHFKADQLRSCNFEVTLVPGSIPTVFTKFKKSCTFCHSRQIGQSKSFYSFPINNPQILKQWLLNMGNEYFQPTKDSYLCSDHFLDNQFRNDKSRISRRLKKNAIPTVFRNDVKKAENRKQTHDNIESETEKRKHLPKENMQTRDNFAEVCDLKINVSDLDICSEVATKQEPQENGLDESFVELDQKSDDDVNEDEFDHTTTQNIIKEKSVLSHHNYCFTESNLKTELKETNKKLFTARRKLRVFKQKVKRLQTKLSTLRDIRKVSCRATFFCCGGKVTFLQFQRLRICLKKMFEYNYSTRDQVEGGMHRLTESQQRRMG